MSLYRSFLFAPGNNARRTGKALAFGADAVILDLEDACPAGEKVATREVVVAALQTPRASKGYIRVNPISTDFGYGDIVACVRAGVDGLVIPKIERADELRTVEWLVRQIEREQGLEPGGIDLVPILETGLGLANARAIAEAGTRVRRLAFGAADFALDLDVAWSSDEAEFGPYRAALVLASRAAGLEPPVDTVWAALPDVDGFVRSAARARAMGFQGKMCIHPDQVGPVHAAFTPDAAQVAWARKVVAAFEEAERTGSAAIRVDGQFIDYPFAFKAQRLLAAARAAGAEV